MIFNIFRKTKKIFLRKVINDIQKVVNANAKVTNVTVTMLHETDELVIIQITSVHDVSLLLYNYFKKGYVSVGDNSYIELINKSGVTIFDSLKSAYEELI